MPCRAVPQQISSVPSQEALLEQPEHGEWTEAYLIDLVALTRSRSIMCPSLRIAVLLPYMD